MNKAFLSVLSAIVVLFCCTMCADNSQYLIVNGTIDPSFDGYNVYFRPQPFPTGDIVDSCKVANGKFSFRLDADSLYVGDLVLSYSSPRRVEPILMAVEPGTLTVHLDSDSQASGTPINDSLAVWKQFIVDNVQGHKFDELYNVQAVFEKRTVEFIKNQPNAVGGYLFFLYNGSFLPESIQELKDLNIYQYIPDVNKRPLKFNK